MDFNKEYADHQHALMRAEDSVCNVARKAHLACASLIAERIGALQRELGAAAACAWSIKHLSAPERA